MVSVDSYAAKSDACADDDRVAIYDSVSKTQKKALFGGGVWNWIVNKLTNAVISNLQTNNKTVLGAINELNSNKVSYVKYKIINPEKGFSLTLDDASIYLICCTGIDADNVRNIGFYVVVSRSSSNTKGDILNIKTEIPQATLSLEKNVLKCTSTVWARIYVIKL